MHQQAKEERDRCAPVGQGQEGWMRTSRPKEERDRCAPAGLRGEGQICTGRLRIRGTDVHQQAKNKRDGCAPAG
jgi:hypothetical protein